MQYQKKKILIFGDDSSMTSLNGTTLVKIDSEKDLSHELSKLETEADVDAFNNKLLRHVDHTTDFNLFMMNTIAQDVQDFRGVIHLAIKKDFFDARLKELFYEENAKTFEFTKDVEYSRTGYYMQGIYEENGYYIFDYRPKDRINNGLKYKGKKIENETIKYEYSYNPEFLNPHLHEVATLESTIKNDEYFFLEEIPNIIVEFTKIKGLYRLTKISGIDDVNIAKQLLYENYEISI